MDTPLPQITEYAPYYNLVAAIVDRSVKDFNKGTAAQKQDAAAFFRDPENAWMFNACDATVHDVIKHRLDGDPFDLKSLKNGKKAGKPSKPAMMFEYGGESRSVSEWCEVMNVSVGCLKARIKKWGVCERAFREMVR